MIDEPLASPLTQPESRASDRNRRMLAHGLRVGEESLPSVSGYIYIPETDSWIRNGGLAMKDLVNEGWRRRKGARVLARRTLYDLSAVEENERAKPAGEKAETSSLSLDLPALALAIRDAAKLVVAAATRGCWRTYARLRTCSKLCRDLVDEATDVRALVKARLPGGTSREGSPNMPREAVGWAPASVRAALCDLSVTRWALVRLSRQDVCSALVEWLAARSAAERRAWGGQFLRCYGLLPPVRRGTPAPPAVAPAAKSVARLVAACELDEKELDKLMMVRYPPESRREDEKSDLVRASIREHRAAFAEGRRPARAGQGPP